MISRTYSTTETYPPAQLGWFIWGLGATMFLIAFYHRVAPAVMADALMSEFQINATALGTLSGFYFYSYVAMQVPTGILVDRWGPRRLLVTGAVIAGVGTLLFSSAPTFWWANVGRFLIGGSVAVAFVATLQLASRWLAPRYFALASGLTLTIGIIGAIAAGVPLKLAIDAFGWRSVMFVSAIIPLFLAVAMWWIIRDHPQDKRYKNYIEHNTTISEAKATNIWTDIREIFQRRNSWLVTLIPSGIVGSLLTFAGLWGVPFLTTHYNLPATQAAALCTMMMIAWATSGPVLGALSDRIGRRKPLYIAGFIGLLLGWSVILFVSNLPIWLLMIVMLLTGIASGCMVISFPFIRESVAPRLSGTAIGVVNGGIMVGPMLMQPGVGWLLDRNWQGDILDGVRLYGLTAYQTGFTLMFVWAIVGFVLLLFTQETYCQPLREDYGK